MRTPYLLHMFNPTKNVSPFDVNMAYEADVDAVIPYSEVSEEDIRHLTQDTIFSRGPEGVKRTGIFIGGREFGLAIEMLEEAKKAMVPPFEVSVMVDPSGAIPTAAAVVACVEYWVGRQGRDTLEGKKVHIIGGTGPVGVCAGVLAASCGAEVYLVSHTGTGAALRICEEYNPRFGVEMLPGDCSTEKARQEFLVETDIIIAAARAGVQVLSHEELCSAPNLTVAADVNAVPPLGLEGVGVNDMGVVLEETPQKAVGIGALAIGDIKYKVHHRLLQIMTDTDQPIYLDHQKAFEVARGITRDQLD